MKEEKKKMGFTTRIIISSIVAMFNLVLLNNIYFTETYIGTITEIESVSAGGFGSLDKCIIYLDGVKLNKEGKWCSYQIGDQLCEKESKCDLSSFLIGKKLIKCTEE